MYRESKFYLCIKLAGNYCNPRSTVTHLTVPDTCYLRCSEVFCSFPTQVSVKFHEDIYGATAPLPRTTHTDSAEGFAMGLCTSDCVDSRLFEVVG